MTETLEPYYFYQDHLSTNQLHTLNYKGTNYTLQCHGPQLGTAGNWLKVAREDGAAKKFGPGHNAEVVWRAFVHADKGWDTPQVPPYREGPVRTDLEKKRVPPLTTPTGA